MVDNSSVPVASGNETFANDDIGGVKYPRPKINWGPDGTANDVDVASGKPLPVQLRSPTGTDLTGTAGSGSAAVLTIQGNASGTPAPVSGTVTANMGTVTADPFGANADAASATGSISAKLRAIATALGVTAFDLGSGTGGSRTLRWFHDTAQWIGGAGATTSATMRATLASDDPAVTVLGAQADAASATTSIKAALRAIATALGTTALDLGSGTGGTRTIRTIIDSSQFGALGATTKSGSVSVARATDDVVGFTVTPAASSTITRPADTTAYASGDLVANSTTAGSVNNLQFTTAARISGGSGTIIGAQIQKSTNSVTNAAFRLHLYTTAPTYTSAGDNSALTTVVVASGKGYLGYIDITAMVGFSDVAWGSGAPDNSRGGIPFVASAQTIYGLLEARGAYTPGNAEAFTVYLDILQD